MSIRHDLEILRRRFWSGDRSARDDLRRLLEGYARFVVRRAWASSAAASPTGRTARPIADVRSPAPDRGDSDMEAAVADFCRQLCDQLLLIAPSGRPDFGTGDTKPAHLDTIADHR